MKVNKIDAQQKGIEEMQHRLNMQNQNMQISNDQPQLVLQNAIKAAENIQQTQIQNISGTVV